jgi:IS30 family transposase
MSRGKRLSEKEKGKIEALRSERYSERQIATKIKSSKTVVHNYLKLKHKYGSKGKRGRKKAFNERERRSIFRMASNKVK